MCCPAWAAGAKPHSRASSAIAFTVPVLEVGAGGQGVGRAGFSRGRPAWRAHGIFSLRPYMLVPLRA